MGPVRVGPAACYVLSPVPFCLTPSATSLSCHAKSPAGGLRGLRTLCAHPQRTNTIKTRQRAPLPIPRVQAVPAFVTGELRAKQLLPVYPASATTVISWNKARMQPHVFWLCSVTLLPLSSASLARSLAGPPSLLLSHWSTPGCIAWKCIFNPSGIVLLFICFTFI